jgi:signal transduction histidine kinase
VAAGLTARPGVVRGRLVTDRREHRTAPPSRPHDPVVRTRLVAVLAAVATAYLVAATVVDPRRLVHDAPGANVAIQTTAALVAVLVAVIALGRFRERRRTADLLLVLALAQIAVANVVFTAIPLAQRVPVVSSRTVWTGLLVRLSGALLLAAAALVRRRVVDASRGAHADEVAVVVVTTVLVAVAYVAAGLLPRLAAAAVDPGRWVWDTAPPVAVLAMLTAFASAVAAVGFVLAHDREPGDELLGWLAVAATAAAGSHAVTAVSFLETYSRYVSSADVLKLACYLLLLGGVVREVRGTWRDHTAAAVAEERRRIARDLHDGLAQELAFVVTRSRRIARRTADDDLWAVCSAAERALAESGRAIAALTRLEDEALDVALAYTAEEVGGRLGTAVTLELDPRVRVPAETQEALLRITREAITNAARHGSASRVHVRLFADHAVRLRVSDNGRGFDAASAPAPGRLGLTGMRERAAAVGADLLVSSRRPGGTDVEVVLA